jgi:hypothetical protein
MVPSNPSFCPDTEDEVEIESLQDFEDHGQKGWLNGKLDSSSSQMTAFLGRFDKNDSFPSKIYQVPNPSAVRVVLQFDFYEIDSWDGDNFQHGTDKFGLVIDGDISSTIDFGHFRYDFSEPSTSGITSSGLKWSKTSYSIADSPQAFNTKFSDQRHKILVEVPKQFFSSGRNIKLTIRWTLVGNVDEFVGIDNVRSLVCIDTIPSISPSVTPSSAPSSSPSNRSRFAYPDAPVLTPTDEEPEP